MDLCSHHILRNEPWASGPRGQGEGACRPHSASRIHEFSGLICPFLARDSWLPSPQVPGRGARASVMGGRATDPAPDRGVRVGPWGGARGRVGLSLGVCFSVGPGWGPLMSTRYRAESWRPGFRWRGRTPAGTQARPGFVVSNVSTRWRCPTADLPASLSGAGWGGGLPHVVPG